MSAVAESTRRVVVPYDSPAKQNETTAWIGMVLFLASWGMMFGALFFTYAGIRARAVEWPPPGLPEIPILLPSINTAVIFMSSIALEFAVRGIRKGRTRALSGGLLVTLILGVVFMALQLVVWSDLRASGLLPTSGFYGSVFYGLTWIHAAHVIIGLVAFVWLTYRAFTGFYQPARFLAVRLWGMYWHFVGFVWALLFISVYLV